MPCNADYMNPTAREIDQFNDKFSKIQEYLNEVVHADDMLREHILAFWDEATPVPPSAYDVLHKDSAERIDNLLASAQEEYAARHNFTSRKRLQDLTVVADRLSSEHELVIRVFEKIVKDKNVTASEEDRIRTDQIIHRHGDMLRVWAHYGSMKRKNHEKIRMLAKVDLTKPLIPQLGFDPDDV